MRNLIQVLVPCKCNFTWTPIMRTLLLQAGLLPAAVWGKFAFHPPLVTAATDHSRRYAPAPAPGCSSMEICAPLLTFATKHGAAQWLPTLDGQNEGPWLRKRFSRRCKAGVNARASHAKLGRYRVHATCMELACRLAQNHHRVYNIFFDLKSIFTQDLFALCSLIYIPFAVWRKIINEWPVIRPLIEDPLRGPGRAEAQRLLWTWTATGVGQGPDSEVQFMPKPVWKTAGGNRCIPCCQVLQQIFINRL